MEDSKLISELVEALNSIQTELRHMNKTLSTIAGQNRPAASEPASRPSVGRPSGRGPVSRGPRTGGYGRSEMSAGASGDGEGGSRFPKKKGPGRPSGKPPAKKGGGYPKKAR